MEKEEKEVHAVSVTLTSAAANTTPDDIKVNGITVRSSGSEVREVARRSTPSAQSTGGAGQSEVKRRCDRAQGAETARQ
ncbi:uncharacterized protein V6R79_018526 [Siganus canaliculatus]